MQLSDLVKRVAMKIRYWDYTSNDVFTGKDIEEADIIDAINDKYIQEVFPLYLKLNQEYYEQEAYANTYIATGTVSASSTGTTLVASSAIFTSDMVNAVVYNSTDSTSAKITAYSNTTTVTVDETIADTWDGDTIYVSNGIYTFGGDATDIYGYPLWVGIKYNTTDDDYTRANLMGDSNAYYDRRGRDYDDLFQENQPIYTVSTVKISSVPTSAIKIKPIPTIPIAVGVYLKYIQQPAALSADADVPRLPSGNHRVLADGAIADLCFGHLDDPEKGKIYQDLYEKGLGNLMDSMVQPDQQERLDRDRYLVYLRDRRV